MDGVGKEMRDPFALNPENTVSEEQKRKVSRMVLALEEVDGLEGWYGCWGHGYGKARVVRRSRSFDGTKSKTLWKTLYFWRVPVIRLAKRKARLASLGLLLGFIVWRTPLKYLVRPFLPKPGDGPQSSKLKTKAGLRATFVAVSEDNDRKICSMDGSWRS